MKRKQSFLLPLLMALVMMAMSPQKGWAKEVSYRVPVYKTAGDPKSGIASWEIKTVDAALVTESVTKQQNTNSPILEAGWYYVSGQATITGGVLCTGDVHLILCDGADLTVTGATVGYGYGIGIEANTGSLTIYAQSEGENMGALSATGNRYCAGIGSTSYQVCNSITINGGKITATGADGGAGIGGSQNQSGSKNITINGGMVTATGGSNAAGIGGGFQGWFYNLTINGGVVKASASDCVAISPGYYGSSSSASVIIGTDGWIKAGDNASSLSQVTNDGSNFYDNYSNHMSFWKKYVEIHVNSYASETAEEAYLKTAANCTDDAVYYHKCAYCDASSQNKTNSTWTKTGSAIGHGSEGYTDTYTWTGTCYNDDTQDTKACTFTLQCNKCSTKVVDGISLDCTKGAHTDATCTVAGSTTYSATGSYTSTNSEYNYSDTKTHDYTIAVTGHAFTNYTYNNDATCTKGGTKTASCDNGCGKKDTKDDPEHPVKEHTFTTYTYNNDATCTKAGTMTASCDNGCGKKDTKDDPEHPATGIHSFTNYTYNNDATCTKAGTMTASCDNGCGATDTKNDPGHTTGHNFVNGTCTICNSTGDEVTYRVPIYNTTGDPTSGIASWSNETAKAIPVTSCSNKQVTWNAGWYYVSGEVTLAEGAVCSGAVHLILCDNASLTVTTYANWDPGINVSGDDNSLTIYAQSVGEQMGVLSATGGEYGGAGIGGRNNSSGDSPFGQNITINGGNVTAKGSQAAGIGGGYKGSGKNITINGGVVTAYSELESAGIGGGKNGTGQNITINGGTVTANGGAKGAGIGSGLESSNETKYITINGGNVTANGGQASAGIGGGRNGSASYIYINGGDVKANGTTDAAGIGGGRNGSGSYIYINGGNVTANGGADASGIGNGYGSSTDASNIFIDSALGTKAGSSENPTEVVANTGGDLASALNGKRYVIVDGAYFAPVAGWYAIGNAEQLISFAEKVNEGNTEIKGRLTKDIDMQGKQFVQIGSSSDHPFKGELDGQYHAIKNLAVNASSDYAASLIGYAQGCTIQRLSVQGTITTSRKYAAGFIGNNSTGVSTITKCISAVDIVSTIDGDGTHAGFAGVTEAGVALSDCAFVGSIKSTTGTTNCAGLIGWDSNKKSSATNCYVIAEVTNGILENQLVRNRGDEFPTCYYLNACGAAQGKQITATQLTSGELCYLLNNGNTDGSQAWYQKVGDGGDSRPVLKAATGNTLYYGYTDCSNTERIYANSTLPTYSHNITAHAKQEPTYTQEGKHAYWSCSNCNYLYADAELTKITTEKDLVIPTIKRAFTSVEQDGTKIASLGTAAFDIDEDTEVTLEFDNEGNAVVTIGGNTVAKVPAQGDMVMDFTTTMAEDELNKVGKTVTAAGYATLYSPFQLAIPAEGTVEVYAPTYDASTHTLSLKGDNKVNGSIIPAGTGVLLKNAGTATFTISADAPTYTNVSALTGSAVKMANPTKSGEVGGMTVYTLGKNSSNACGFFRYKGDYLNAGQAYLYSNLAPASIASLPTIINAILNNQYIATSDLNQDNRIDLNDVNIAKCRILEINNSPSDGKDDVIIELKAEESDEEW